MVIGSKKSKKEKKELNDFIDLKEAKDFDALRSEELLAIVTDLQAITNSLIFHAAEDKSNLDIGISIEKSAMDETLNALLVRLKVLSKGPDNELNLLYEDLTSLVKDQYLKAVKECDNTEKELPINKEFVESTEKELKRIVGSFSDTIEQLKKKEKESHEKIKQLDTFVLEDDEIEEYEASINEEDFTKENQVVIEVYNDIILDYAQIRKDVMSLNAEEFRKFEDEVKAIESKKSFSESDIDKLRTYYAAEDFQNYFIKCNQLTFRNKNSGKLYSDLTKEEQKQIDDRYLKLEQLLANIYEPNIENNPLYKLIAEEIIDDLNPEDIKQKVYELAKEELGIIASARFEKKVLCQFSGDFEVDEIDKLEGADLSNMILANARFLKLPKNVEMTGADLRGVVFNGNPNEFNFTTIHKARINSATNIKRTNYFIFDEYIPLVRVAEDQGIDLTKLEVRNDSLSYNIIIAATAKELGKSSKELEEEICKNALDSIRKQIAQLRENVDPKDLAAKVVSDNLVSGLLGQYDKVQDEGINYVLKHQIGINGPNNEPLKKLIENINKDNVISVNGRDIEEYSQLHREHSRLSASEKKHVKSSSVNARTKLAKGNEISKEEEQNIKLELAQGSFAEYIAAKNGKKSKKVSVIVEPNTELNHVDLSQGDFRNIGFNGVTFNECIINECEFKDASFTNCNFVKCQISDTSFKRAIFDKEVVFEGNEMSRVTFKLAKLRSVIFGDKVLNRGPKIFAENYANHFGENVSFKDADMNDVIFNGNIAGKINFHDTKFGNTSFSKHVYQKSFEMHKKEHGDREYKGPFIDLTNNTERIKYGFPRFKEDPNKIRKEDYEAMIEAQAWGAGAVAFLPGAAAGLIYFPLGGLAGAATGALMGGVTAAYSAKKAYSGLVKTPYEGKFGFQLAKFGMKAEIVATNPLKEFSKHMNDPMVKLAATAGVAAMPFSGLASAQLGLLVAAGLATVRTAADIYHGGEMQQQFTIIDRAENIHDLAMLAGGVHKQRDQNIEQAKNNIKKFARDVIPTKRQLIITGLVVAAVGIGALTGGLALAVAAPLAATAGLLTYLGYKPVVNLVNKLFGKKDSKNHISEIGSNLDNNERNLDLAEGRGIQQERVQQTTIEQPLRTTEGLSRQDSRNATEEGRIIVEATRIRRDDTPNSQPSTERSK